jgi:hypothetical protein
MYGSSCCTGLLPSRDDNEEQDDEDEDTLDDSMERILFSAVFLLNELSCTSNSNEVKMSNMWSVERRSEI